MISEGSSKLIGDSEAEAHHYGSSRYLVLRRSSSARSNQPHAVRDTAMGRDVAYIKHSLKNCRISPSNEGKTQETQGSYAHLFVTQASRTYSHATSMLAKDSFGTAVGLREERVLVAMTVALGEAGQPEHRDARVGWTLCCTSLEGRARSLSGHLRCPGALLEREDEGSRTNGGVALGAVVVVMAAKENVAAVEEVAARVTVEGIAAVMTSVVGPHRVVMLMMRGVDGCAWRPTAGCCVLVLGVERRAATLWKGTVRFPVASEASLRFVTELPVCGVAMTTGNISDGDALELKPAMLIVEETLQPIADDALRDDSDYIRVIEHIGYRCSVPFFSSFIITDGVVVWRAWVICSDQNKAILMTLAAILAIDSLIVPGRLGLITLQTVPFTLSSVVITPTSGIPANELERRGER
ncbi:hypothetical protein V8E52_011987 [Russula decolorans]